MSPSLFIASVFILSCSLASLLVWPDTYEQYITLALSAARHGKIASLTQAASTMSWSVGPPVTVQLLSYYRYLLGLIRTESTLEYLDR